MKFGIFLVNWIRDELVTKTSAAMESEWPLASSCHSVSICLHWIFSALPDATDPLFFLRPSNSRLGQGTLLYIDPPDLQPDIVVLRICFWSIQFLPGVRKEIL
jgi:hypothetical protein